MKFLKELQKRIFPFIVVISALTVSASAAFYSVTGLSKLFAGARVEVLIMTSSLEIAKLIIATLLHNYWSSLNKLLKTYLTISVIILVAITSMGIYGFLSSAYQETASKSGIIEKEISILELKKNRFLEERTYLIDEKETLDESILELRNGLSNNVIQYRDSKTGEIITTTSSSTRKALEGQLNEALTSKKNLTLKIENVTDSINTLDIKILDVENNSDVASELGPLKYISELTNTPMNKIVNYLLLIIAFVFDPLAISLVIAANFLFSKLRKEKNNILDLEETDDTLLEETKEEVIEQEKVIEEIIDEEEVIEEEQKPENIVITQKDIILNETKSEDQPKKNKRLVYKKRDAED